MFSEFEGKEVIVMVPSYATTPWLFKGKLVSSDDETTTILSEKMTQMAGIVHQDYDGEKMTINNRFIISVRETN